MNKTIMINVTVLLLVTIWLQTAGAQTQPARWTRYQDLQRRPEPAVCPDLLGQPHIMTVVRDGRSMTTVRRSAGAGVASGLPSRGIGLLNGDFSDGLNGWSFDESGGDASPGQVYVDSGEAVLMEGDSFLVTLSQTFTVPPDAAELSFNVMFDPGFDLSDDFIPDAFEVSLLDENFLPVVDPWDAMASSFYNVQEDGTINQGATTTWDGLTATVDVRGVAPGTVVTLFFDFIGADVDTAGAVRVDDALITEDCTPHPFGDVTDDNQPSCPPGPGAAVSGCGLLIDLPDIVYLLNAFSQGSSWAVCYPNADLMPCGGDGGVDLPDIVAVLHAFAGQYDCMSDCPCP